ncbi:FCS-Like Zinc finger 17-like [Punica granatum]|uniref:FCS-Like Zinc finger 17-like n=1 Tax=Punica granatum TaxID=22663 RepID=A0A6P8CU59_PUNGR|nr:FCS-Like Zinc finger 17-like [Punica granatum]
MRKSSCFKREEEEEEEEQQETSESSSKTSTSSVAVGLRMILTQQTKLPSNVVVKHNKLSTTNSVPTVHHQPIRASLDDFNCYLQSCQLCHKKLCPDKDVYMYRGDQGFCSEECRNRQILMDDMRELEASTRKLLASRHCYSDGPKSETRLLLEEQLQRRNQIPVRKTRAIIS